MSYKHQNKKQSGIEPATTPPALETVAVAYYRGIPVKLPHLKQL